MKRPVVIEEVKRRWRIFYRFWCGGISYALFCRFYPTIGNNHRWLYEEGRCKRTCSRCGQHEWVFSKKYPRIGEPASSWRKMNHDELRWL